MAKPKVLLLKTGGTVCQKPNRKGVLVPSRADYLRTVKNLGDLARVDVADVGMIDSTDMETNYRFSRPDDPGLKDRTDIARAIYDHANGYDGFVVVHGTDTMVETAAALTYMLPGFRKPIVLTGAQKSAWVAGSDAQNNIYRAVNVAIQNLGEVVISFGNRVVRGTRAKKIDEEGFNAFDSPGVEPLGRFIAVGNGIQLAGHRIRRRDFTPEIFTDFDPRVFNYDHVSGGMSPKLFNRISADSEVRAIMMGGFGAGNIPSSFIKSIELSDSSYRPVFVYTRCLVGSADMGIYAVGDAALKAGAVSAGDMTPEALGQKLMFALGQAKVRGICNTGRGDKFIKKTILTPINKDITPR